MLPLITKAFGAAIIFTGNTTSLAFSIYNPNLVTTLTGVAFSDTLPSGLIMATPSGLSITCGGTATATAGSSLVSLSGASLAAGAFCTITLNVYGATTGNKDNSCLKAIRLDITCTAAKQQMGHGFA